jgi:DSHCT (NUC185) domain
VFVVCAISHINFFYSDISNCEVVTAWAAGCSWSEAVEISGSPPGDLARILSRVLDAMRQFGGLPFSPIRRQDFEKQSQAEISSRGLDQEVRRLCREATRAINRYPLKDPLSFTAAEDDDVDDDESEVEEENIDIVVDNDDDEALQSDAKL